MLMMIYGNDVVVLFFGAVGLIVKWSIPMYSTSNDLCAQGGEFDKKATCVFHHGECETDM